MSSSISSSETSDTPQWRRWLIAFAAFALGGFLLLFAFVVVADPYSSGRLTPFKQIDIALKNRLYANAGRVRDPRFDSAIVGNSHAVRIDPAIVSSATGRRFVQLAIEGTHPSEHLFLTEQFARYHAKAAYVIVLDELACVGPGKEGIGFVVPRWLYAGDNFEYLSKIVSPASLRAAIVRLRIVLGQGRDLVPANGYDALDRPTRAFFPVDRHPVPGAARASADLPADAPFPAIDRIAATLAKLDQTSAVLFVFTPVYESKLPAPSSDAERRFNACKTKIRTLAAQRPRSALLDMRIDGDIARNADNFTDVTHYSDDVAKVVAAKIGEQLKSLGGR